MENKTHAIESSPRRPWAPPGQEHVLRSSPEAEPWGVKTGARFSAA